MYIYTRAHLHKCAHIRFYVVGVFMYVYIYIYIYLFIYLFTHIGV